MAAAEIDADEGDVGLGSEIEEKDKGIRLGSKRGGLPTREVRKGGRKGRTSLASEEVVVCNSTSGLWFRHRSVV